MCSTCSAVCRYLNAVQTTAQHLLRYLAAAVVVNKRRRSLLKDMVKVRPALCTALYVPWTWIPSCLRGHAIRADVNAGRPYRPGLGRGVIRAAFSR